VIDALAAVGREGTIGFPDEVDIVFAVDSTGSMEGEIDGIKVEIEVLIDGLRAAARETDFRFYETTKERSTQTLAPIVTIPQTMGCRATRPSATSNFLFELGPQFSYDGEVT
jgi:hypothetical protein